MIKQEFDGLRAVLYEHAMATDPTAREDDIKAMYKYLEPKQGENILGLGEGNGYFCRSIAEAVGQEGIYLVTDPSLDQLTNLEKRVSLPQLTVKQMGAETLEVPLDYFDKVWSFGAFHHCPNQTQAMKHSYNALKENGTMVICDVFQHSSLAQHFDGIVARYCATGHEVKFMSESFARTLCYLAGFKDHNVRVVDLPQTWRFQTEYALGEFIYGLHALINLPGTREEQISQTIEGCKRILGIEQKNGLYELCWPMKALIAKKIKNSRYI